MGSWRVHYIQLFDFITCNKAFDIGVGKAVKVKPATPLEVLGIISEPATTPKYVKFDPKSRSKDASQGVVFHCPESGCTVTKNSHAELIEHIESSDHHMQLEAENAMDKAKIMYFNIPS